MSNQTGPHQCFCINTEEVEKKLGVIVCHVDTEILRKHSKATCFFFFSNRYINIYSMTDVAGTRKQTMGRDVTNVCG